MLESPSNKFPLLLGSKESEATLYVTRQELCSSIYKPQIPGRFDQHSSRYDVLKEVKVNVTTLDSLIEKEHSLEKIHLIRIVTQGSEYEILQGAIKTCDKYQPLIFVHTWLNSIYHESGNLEQILGWARLNGYVAIDLKPAVTWLPKGTEINSSKREVIGVSVLLCRKNIFEDNYEDNRLQSHSSIEHISYILSNYGFTALASFLIGKNDRTASDKRMALNLALFLNSPALLKRITHFLKGFLSLK
ncbi:FkbM family methyltransferase [Candidatus Planktophila lacus]|uniref:FkbM family methyltransferase n=1 Tax=Candidatus Planktophila lacus TaxID=1884913 RepID=UPI00167FE26E|nr:FkbM family methyltransferase [Candidatus Planktophila lacus]